MMTKKWDFENDGRTQVRYAKGTCDANKPTAGCCFGYSLVWASKMADGAKDMLSKPTIVRAAPLQQRVEVKQATKCNGGMSSAAAWDAAVSETASITGSQANLACTGSHRKVTRHVRDNVGFYIIDLIDHWVGMGKTDATNYYYFDSNDGLFHYTTPEGFYDHVRHDIHNNYRYPGNKNYKAYLVS